MNKRIPLYFAVVGTLWCALVQGQEPADIANMESMTTLEIMNEIITPATNTLWGISDSPDENEWSAMVKAATINLEASKLIAKGASTPQDKQWASDKVWQDYSQEMILATEQMLTAAKAKNLDAFYAGSDAVYPPCEGCHKAFNPAVVNQ
jgi:cytochrome c556